MIGGCPTAYYPAQRRPISEPMMHAQGGDFVSDVPLMPSAPARRHHRHQHARSCRACSTWWCLPARLRSTSARGPTPNRQSMTGIPLLQTALGEHLRRRPRARPRWASSPAPCSSPRPASAARASEDDGPRRRRRRRRDPAGRGVVIGDRGGRRRPVGVVRRTGGQRHGCGPSPSGCCCLRPHGALPGGRHARQRTAAAPGLRRRRCLRRVLRARRPPLPRSWSRPASSRRR